MGVLQTFTDTSRKKAKLYDVQLLQETQHSRIYSAVTLDQCRVVLKQSLSRNVLGHEIAIMRSLAHPNIIRYYGMISYNGDQFILMDYCNGGNLLSHLDATFAEKLYWVYQLADALCYLRREQVLHRDIKPENVLLHDGNVVLVDFNCAVRHEIIHQDRAGTIGYMAPEVFEQRLYSFEADVFSFGVLIFELFARKKLIQDDKFYQNIEENARCQITRVPRCLRKLLFGMICGQEARYDIDDVFSELYEISFDRDRECSVE